VNRVQASRPRRSRNQKRVERMSPAADGFFPSPGTPGEGWGEGHFVFCWSSGVRIEVPHPDPLRSTGRGRATACLLRRRPVANRPAATHMTTAAAMATHAIVAVPKTPKTPGTATAAYCTRKIQEKGIANRLPAPDWPARRAKRYAAAKTPPFSSTTRPRRSSSEKEFNRL